MTSGCLCIFYGNGYTNSLRVDYFALLHAAQITLEIGYLYVSSAMKPESNNIEDYLKYDSVVDWNKSAIQQQAKEIIKGAVNKIDKIQFIYEWVRDEIPHSNDINVQVLTCSASEVLSNKTGICFSKSHLLAALLRSVHIPAGFCYQVLRVDPPIDNTLVLHGLNGIYISEIQKWVIADARGNTQDINAQFRTDMMQLAFEMDDSAGEFLYETIFISPFEHVVEKLRKYKNRSEFQIFFDNF